MTRNFFSKREMITATIIATVYAIRRELGYDEEDPSDQKEKTEAAPQGVELKPLSSSSESSSIK